MIDQLWLSPNIHVIFGAVVLAATLAALVVTALRAWRHQPLSTGGYLTLIVAQVALMVQALLGIKLLDQGLGAVQVYIHYLGGLGPLLFFLLYYWLPKGFRARRWTATGVSGAAFLFAVMAFGIGMSFVNKA
jgi:heme A synthase